MYKSKRQGVLGGRVAWRRGPARPYGLGVRYGGRCIVLLGAPPMAALAAVACVFSLNPPGRCGLEPIAKVRYALPQTLPDPGYVTIRRRLVVDDPAEAAQIRGAPQSAPAPAPLC